MDNSLATQSLVSQSLAIQSTVWSSLLELARQGDDDAFGQICDRMTGYLLLTTNRLGNSLPAKFGASDIVQQTLMEARRDIASFRGEDENDLQAWLVQLVRNNLIDAARYYRHTEKRDIAREFSKNSGELVGDFPDSAKTASSIFCHQETDEQMLRALADLPEQWQRVVKLRLWEEWPFAKIGSELKISSAAARKIMARALDKLRQKLSADYDDRPSQPR